MHPPALIGIRVVVAELLKGVVAGVSLQDKRRRCSNPASAISAQAPQIGVYRHTARMWPAIQHIKQTAAEDRDSVGGL
jgi:hypothetical protein